MLENYILSVSNAELKIFILSMLPITELRFSIPYGYFVLDTPLWIASGISILGNITIGYITLSIIGPIMSSIQKISFFSFIIKKIFIITRRKSDIIDRLKIIGLLFFIGIPMPFTGVWTGSLGAYLFGLNRNKSILAIIGGVLLSSFIVSIICYGSKEMLLYFNIII